MPRRVVAIHQPNFFPWLGYFDKIARADVFIVLDHVQFPKPRGSWTNRVKVLVNGEAAWATAPVEHNYPGFRRIDEINVDQRTPWRRKLVNLLQPNYARAASFKEVFPEVRGWIECEETRLADYNVNAITRVCAAIGMRTAHFVRSSTLGVEGDKAALLVDLVKAVSGNVYLSGDGAGEYMQDELFTNAGIAVEYQAFPHPVYSQGSGTFVPGLSILDALFHCGFEGTAKVLERTQRVDGGAPR
jgi:hypothetical protein